MNSINNVYIGHSSDESIRYKASSGGIGSCIVRYLFENGLVNSILSFKYNYDLLKYEPQIIYDINDYQISGSIYHEINIYSYIKEHITEIKGSFACFALPCQVRSIKTLLENNGIPHFIIQLTCSSQQTFEATEYLLKRLSIEKSAVNKIRYRGYGWPSGIAITLKNGKQISVDNQGTIWTKIFHSRLFCMSRCFYCNPNMISYADIIISDPWRIISSKDDNIGHTLCCVKSQYMNDILQQMCAENILILQNIECDMFNYSQEGVLLKKIAYMEHPKLISFLKYICLSTRYRKLVLKYNFCFSLHLYLIRIIEKIIM